MNQFLDFNYLRSNCTKIHAFGLGFIQIKLGEIFRVHIYCQEAGLTTQEEEIHNHRYDFKSTVLKGQLTNKIYQVEENSSGPYLVVNEACNPNLPKDLKTKLVAPPKLITEFVTGPNQSYFLEKDALHRVLALDNTITVVERGPVIKPMAQIVHHSQQPLVCPFSVNLPEDKLWELVKEKI